MDEDICVCFGAVAYAEVVHHKTKGNVSGCMAEEAGGVWALCESVLCQMIDEAYLREFTSLGKAVHAFADLEVDVAMLDVRV
jgi:hypothetical protein